MDGKDTNLVVFPNGRKFTMIKPTSREIPFNKYKKYKCTVVFYSEKGTPFIALAICNTTREPFFVTCHWVNAKEDDYRIRYMYGLCTLDGVAVGLDKLGYKEQHEFAVSLKKQLGYDNP